MGAGKKRQQAKLAGEPDKRDPAELTRKRELYARMTTLAQTISESDSDEELMSSSGAPLNYDEKEALGRILPRARHVSTGRSFRVTKSGSTVDAGYDCVHNLAGAVYVVTSDGWMLDAPLVQSKRKCNHMRCTQGAPLKSGGTFDGVVLSTSLTKAELGPDGVFSDKCLGSKAVWQSNYPSAVLASKYMRARLPMSKYRSLLGTQFTPKTQFGEAIGLMLVAGRVVGMKLSYYHDHYELYNKWSMSMPGSTRELEKLNLLLQAGPSVRMSNYSWGFHHWCRMKSMFPDINIFVSWFVADPDHLSSQTLLKTRTFFSKFEPKDHALDFSRQPLTPDPYSCVSYFEKRGRDATVSDANDLTARVRPVRSIRAGFPFYDDTSQFRTTVDEIMSCFDDRLFNAYYKRLGLQPVMLDMTNDLGVVTVQNALTFLPENKGEVYPGLLPCSLCDVKMLDAVSLEMHVYGVHGVTLEEIGETHSSLENVVGLSQPLDLFELGSLTLQSNRVSGQRLGPFGR